MQQVNSSADALYQLSPESAEALKTFQQGLENNSLETMREIYTVTFDMQPFCYPYIGYCLFGESYKRGAFMAQLNEAYRKFDFSASQELPDHLPVVLRFLSLQAVDIEDEFCQALIYEGILPALEK
ncbi:MAG: nitrate reductase molybdenum cofactor assembly chaperone, partial [Anaerolineales bacterium]